MAASGPGGAAAPPARSVRIVRTAPIRAHAVARRETLSECEARLEQARDGRPDMAVVGASYTAGVGPGAAALSWADLLARELRWNAVIDGVPGVGYVRLGNGRAGPISRLLDREDLRALDPSLVIVQAGHDDSGVPASLERQRVIQAIDAIRAAAPRARIALLTVFAGPSRPVSAALYRVDGEIIAAGLAADPGAISMNPLGGWHYAHAHGGLHPTAAGDAWIAGTAAAILRAHGVLPAAAGGRAPVICDSGTGARTRAGARATRLQ
jgi:lysophospholipase L1-like esterase